MRSLTICFVILLGSFFPELASAGIGSCSFSYSNTAYRCDEYDYGNGEKDCNYPPATTWTLASCPAGAVGKCRYNDTSMTLYVYRSYGDTTSAASDCSNAGATWISLSGPGTTTGSSSTSDSGSSGGGGSISNSRVFAYAEGNYSQLFSGTSTTGQYQQYSYRYYPATRNYLAIDNNGTIFIMGPVSGGAIQSVGAVASFANTITAWEATQTGGSTSGGAAGSGSSVTSQGSSGNPDIVTVVGLNRFKQNGVLNISNSVGDTLSIKSDGTYTFATPLTAVARLHYMPSNPAGNSCGFTRNRPDAYDPHTGQFVTSNTSEIYCYESPCGQGSVTGGATFGQAPAPKGLTATTNPDSSVTLNWKKDPWSAFNYWIYWGTNPNPTPDSTGYTRFGSSTFSDAGSPPQTISNLTPNTTYYFAIASEYRSPSENNVCQSAASTAVSATITAATPAPNIVSMSPISGAVGTSVTITGTNFSKTPANNTVKFNGVQATVTAATSTSLTVTVPSGATTGTVSVTTVSGVGTSAGSFTVSTSVAQIAGNLISSVPDTHGASTFTLIQDTSIAATRNGWGSPQIMSWGSQVYMTFGGSYYYSMSFNYNIYPSSEIITGFSLAGLSKYYPLLFGSSGDVSCVVSGIDYNSPPLPTCASFGVKFDRTQGILTFSSTPLSDYYIKSTTFTTNVTGTVNFTPF